MCTGVESGHVLERANMNAIPVLKTRTPPWVMYSMKACFGRYLAGGVARPPALFAFRTVHKPACFELSTAFEGLFVCWCREDCSLSGAMCGVRAHEQRGEAGER